MRIKNEIPEWCGYLICAVLAPLWIPAVLVILLIVGILASKRKLIGPYVGHYQKWFAWHPVEVYDDENSFDSSWVWLENVNRTLYHKEGKIHYYDITADK